jgi:hypothetical protein
LSPRGHPNGGTDREAKEALKIENRKFEIGRGRGSVSAPSRARLRGSGVRALPSNVRGLISRGLERKWKNIPNVLIINDLRIDTQVLDSSPVTTKKGVFRIISHP